MLSLIDNSSRIKDMYKVKALALVGGEEIHTFDNKEDALKKVRQFRDVGGFIVTIEEVETKQTVS
jgi:putative intracellular protease/amidase